MTTKRSAGTNDLRDEIDFFREKILQMLLELQEQQERPEVGTIACALIEIAIDLASLMPQRSARSQFCGGNRPRWPRSDSAARSTACEARALSPPAWLRSTAASGVTSLRTKLGRKIAMLRSSFAAA